MHDSKYTLELSRQRDWLSQARIQTIPSLRAVMAIRNRSCISPREAYRLLVFPATFSLILACSIFQIIFIISLIHLYLHFQPRESNCAALKTALQPLTTSSWTHFDFKSHTARPVAHTHTDTLYTDTHTHTDRIYTHTVSHTWTLA